MSRPCLLAGVLLATFASPAGAATPARLHLSGHLTTAGGEPVTAALPMTFRLYAGAEDADALWAEPHDAVDVLDGRFDVVLGGTVALDPALLARPLPLFAGVTVGEAGGGDGVEVLPRTEVGGVALALRVPVADRAETLSDVSALAGQVSARLLADHLADLRGDSGPDGTPGVDGSDGVHCWAALGDPEPGQPWTAADCRGAPGAPGGPGSDGPPGADCWASVGDLTGDDLEDTRDCQGPRGPRGPGALRRISLRLRR